MKSNNNKNREAHSESEKQNDKTKPRAQSTLAKRLCVSLTGFEHFTVFNDFKCNKKENKFRAAFKSTYTHTFSHFVETDRRMGQSKRDSEFT